MQYGQIIMFLAIGFAIYYIVMIVMDLQKANAAKLAEAENNKEEDIDISDEAKQFNPIKITREAKPKQTETQNEDKTDEKKQGKQESSKDKNVADNSQQNNPQPKTDVQNSNSHPSANNQSTTNVQLQAEVEKQDTEQQPRRNLRKAVMTDGIEVEKLVELADAGMLEEKLGTLVTGCENAMMNIE